MQPLRTKRISRKTLQAGFADLERIAIGDYHRSLFKIVGDEKYSPEDKYIRIGRLIGVSMKEPFAESHGRKTRSKYSGSYRAWHLVDASFDSPGIRVTWQYQTLEMLRRTTPFGRTNEDVHELARDAQDERGFFGYLAMSLRGYICGDPELRKKIDEYIKGGKEAGFYLKHLTPDVIVQAGGLALGSLLIAHIPILGFVGAPVVAGLVLMIYTIGVDAFCKWSERGPVRGLRPEAELEERAVTVRSRATARKRKAPQRKR